MKKDFFISVFFVICSFGTVYSQEKINEFVVHEDETHNKLNAFQEYGEKHDTAGVVVIYTSIQNVTFGILSVDKNRLIDVVPDSMNNRYLLIIQKNDKVYRHYTITLIAPGFKKGEITNVVVKEKLSSAYVVNPKYFQNSSGYSATITVYGKDGKPLEGAKLTNRETGKFERTNSDGVGTIKFEREGQSASITISHNRYSDTKDIVVLGGDNQSVTLFNYNSLASSNKKKTPRVSKLKPEKHTMDIGAIGGTNLGLSMDFTLSYFLLGFGVDWMVLAPEQTATSALANSGYTGSFSKTTTTVFSGSRTNVFINIGLYFKYFSISCQGGLLCGTTVNRTSSYEGWGYGLVDDDLNEYWSNYERRSFSISTSDKESHFTLTPQVKGYIPFGKNKSISLSVGLGYTFIPSLDYYAGLSGSLGIHFRY